MNTIYASIYLYLLQFISSASYNYLSTGILHPWLNLFLGLQQMVLGDLDSYMQKMKLDYQLMPYRKINSRCIIDLNISSNTIKVLEENIGRKISDIPRSNILTDMAPKGRGIKERINKWDLIKIKSFCMAKENGTKLQRESTVWENIFANDTSDTVLISNISKELTGLQSRKTTQLKNGQRT